MYKRFKDETGVSPELLTKEKACELLEEWSTLNRKISNMTLSDAGKEFEDFARISYGLDGDVEDINKDFKAVRGEPETNKVIVKMKSEIEKFNMGLNALREKISKN